VVAGIEQWGLDGRRLTALCLIVLSAWAIAGCGDDGAATSAENTGAPSSSTNGNTTAQSGEEESSNGRDGKVTVVFRAETATLGRILFDENGYTLYRFSKDKGTTSSCYGACAEKWPPLATEGQLKARKVKFKELGVTKRKDGSLQVTYFGHPLYGFVGDEQTGEASGNGAHAFGGEWRAMHPSGKDVEG
jgi:predicted lipoprotein with Yx(FWY)xxD motif